MYTNVYKKPLIHDAKLILEILLFGSWSSKLPGFTGNLHDFGTKSRLCEIIPPHVYFDLPLMLL